MVSARVVTSAAKSAEGQVCWRGLLWEPAAQAAGSLLRAVSAAGYVLRLQDAPHDALHHPTAPPAPMPARWPKPGTHRCVYICAHLGARCMHSHILTSYGDTKECEFSRTFKMCLYIFPHYTISAGFFNHEIH